jgi:cyanate permease
MKLTLLLYGAQCLLSWARPMAATSLIPLKRQYFLAYAIMGSLMPFMAVFLKQKGFEETQIGSALGASHIAVLLTPVVLACWPDTKFESRYIMATVFALSSVAVAGTVFHRLFLADSVVPVLAEPGLCRGFAAARRSQLCRASGAKRAGTVGHTLPSHSCVGHPLGSSYRAPSFLLCSITASA